MTPARPNVIRGPWRAPEPAQERLYFGRSLRWFGRELITLTVLIGFVVLIAHLAGAAGVFMENPS